MKIYPIVLLFFLITFSSVTAQDQTERITTKWATEINAKNVHAEYPRPQMTRDQWMNLNGLWEYVVLQEGQQPNTYEGHILVPFPIESQLSGVHKRITEKDIIWYRRTFELPREWVGQRVLLHFGAVDWEATVYINGKVLGTHQGGYDPFSIDITHQLADEGQQEIMVRVWDPTSKGYQPIGKQKSDPSGIFYTPVTGIWQTVWLEPVPVQSISSLKITPDIDNESVSVIVNGNITNSNENGITIKVLVGENEIAKATGEFGNKIELQIPNPKLWSPDQPFLYNLDISYTENNKVVDNVSSYFGMRKIALKKDANGHQRLTLNNEYLFQLGTLDQGWWPDGLYTAPTDEALQYDIETTKQLGFNMIRKHVKVEPARWYYHCDRLGMLVWQDMPNGDGLGKWKPPAGYDFLDGKRSPQSAHQYRKEWQSIMDANYNHPSIVVWVPFNEAWGQYNTEEIINWTMDYDPSRLVDGPSGGNLFPVGHMVDTHVYPGPGMPDANKHAPIIFKDRALILGEFGGLGLPLEDHLWQKDKNWGYRNIQDRSKLEASYAELINQIPSLIRNGLAAAIYTQTTDVEGEVNGLMTYDRAIIKMDPKKTSQVNKQLHDVKIK